MSCWRNGGLDDISDNWQAMGIVFDANNFGDIDGVRLVDINGDVSGCFPLSLKLWNTIVSQDP